MLADGDDAVAQNGQNDLDSFKQHQRFLLATFTNPLNLKPLGHLTDVIGDYEQSLNKMRSAYVNSAKVRAEMGVNAGRAAEMITAIADTMMKLEPSDPARFNQAQLIANAQMDLQLVRYEVRSYTGNPADKTEQAAFQQLDVAISGVDKLKSALGAIHSDKVAQLDTALRTYKASVQALKMANDAINDARKDMTAQGAEILKVGDELYSIQLHLVEADTSQARTLQIGCTLLVLLLGIVAAILITRQITRPLQQTLEVVNRIASGDLLTPLR